MKIPFRKMPKKDCLQTCKQCCMDFSPPRHTKKNFAWCSGRNISVALLLLRRASTHGRCIARETTRAPKKTSKTRESNWMPFLFFWLSGAFYWPWKKLMQTVQSCFFTFTHRAIVQPSNTALPSSQEQVWKRNVNQHIFPSPVRQDRRQCFFNYTDSFHLGIQKKRKANGKRPDPQKSLFSHLLSLCFFAQFVERAPPLRKISEKNCSSWLVVQGGSLFVIAQSPIQKYQSEATMGTSAIQIPEKVCRFKPPNQVQSYTVRITWRLPADRETLQSPCPVRINVADFTPGDKDFPNTPHTRPQVSSAALLGFS